MTNNEATTQKTNKNLEWLKLNSGLTMATLRKGMHRKIIKKASGGRRRRKPNQID